jgi:hypothetical protein
MVHLPINSLHKICLLDFYSFFFKKFTYFFIRIFAVIIFIRTE